MLTEKQYSLLKFIDSFVKENGFSPSFEEMKNALKIKSKSSIHALISSLVERGFIERPHHKSRAIKVLYFPEDQMMKAPSPLFLKIPLLGIISAGSPIEAIENHTQDIDVPISSVPQTGQSYYALTIEGDSMEEKGILNSDTVIIEKCSQARNGMIIVALIEKRYATLKTFFQESKDKIFLKPANRHYSDQVFHPKDIEIQGRLVGLIRKYH